MKKKILVVGLGMIFFMVVLIVFTLVNLKKNFYKTDYNKLDLGNVNKLMIVAHPDDEILWGSTKLLQDNYLVVCITCGSSNPKRVKEFEAVMSETGDAYVMLDYPDKTRGKIDNWKKVENDIIRDLENIYNLKDWKEIVTHNPEGEYGHIHHKMTSRYVTNIVKRDKLKYFGKYYSKKKLEETGIVLPKMSDNLLKRKEEILELYATQKNTILSFSHMIASENIITYNEWVNMYEKN